MGFLQRTKERTAQDIRAEINKVNADRDAMARRLKEIEQVIADLWGNGTNKLEMEYGAVSVRLAASNKVLERLEAELYQAETDELMNLLSANEDESARTIKELKSAQAEEAEALKALEAARRKTGEIEHKRTLLAGKERQLRKQIEQRGIGRGEMNTYLQSVKSEGVA